MNDLNGTFVEGRVFHEDRLKVVQVWRVGGTDCVRQEVNNHTFFGSIVRQVSIVLNVKQVKEGKDEGVTHIDYKVNEEV